MKITFVNRLMGIARGGGETFDLNMACALQRLEHDVHFVAGRRVRRIDVPLDGFPTTYVATPYLRWMQYRYESSPSRMARRVAGRASELDRLMFEAMAFRQISRSDLSRSDVFQVCGLPRIASWLELKIRRRAVVRWPGPPGPELSRWRSRYSANIANGKALEDARQYDPSAHEIRVGVDTEVFRSESSARYRAKFGIPSDAITVLFVGRLIPIKNVQLLIDGFAPALERFPTLHLVLVGDGPDGPRLRQQVDKLGLSERTFFAGARDTQEVAEFFRAADIFALTSTYDNFPNAVLEAMSSELPIVATRVGGIPLQVDDGVNGYLVESGDADGLASAIVRLAENPEIRRQMGRENRRKVESTYDWRVSAEKLLAVYSGLL